MPHLVPVRDADGQIAALAAPDEMPPVAFPDLLAGSLHAVGAIPPASANATLPANESPASANAESPANGAGAGTPRSPGPRLSLASMAALGLLVAIGLALVVGGGSPAPTVRLPPTPAPSAVPTHTAAPTPALPLLPQAIVAWAAPGGTVLGALEVGRPYTVTARSGLEWLQLSVSGSGSVWVRASDLGRVTATVPDLATATPAPPPTAILVPAQVPIAPAAPDTEPHLTAPCDAATALFHIRSPVIGPKGEPYGSVDGISCVSLAEAEHNAQVLARQVLDNVTATAIAQDR